MEKGLVDVTQWPIVQVDSSNLNAISWEHLATQVNEAVPPPAGGAIATGRSVWRGHLGQTLCGISWQWAIIEPGICAVDDPMRIDTNCIFTSESPKASELLQSRCLMSIVYGLEWYPYVAAMLGGSPTYSNDSAIRAWIAMIRGTDGSLH